MQFASHSPKAPLDKYIETLWWHEIPGHHGRELILPSPHMELIINMGQPHKVFRDEELGEFEWQKDAWLAGMQTHYLAIESTTSHMIGARFKPGGAHAFFEKPISEFTDRVVPLNELWGDEAGALRERVLTAPSTEDRFLDLEAALLAKYRTDAPSFEMVREAIQRLEGSAGQGSIHAIAELLGVSHKHLTDEFQRIVGIRPKQYARMLRFSSTLETLDPSQPVDWKQLAYRAEFYDQSHFINEFKAFTGLTPTEYQQLWRRLHLQMGDFDPRFVPLGDNPSGG
jgi:AraC-like DNA-binding protein